MSVNAQSHSGLVSWYNPQSRLVEAVELITGQHFQLGKGTTDTLDSFILQGNIEERLAPKSNVFWIGGKGICTTPGYLSVYEIDTALQTITRIDETWQRGNNFFALQFEREGQIFSWNGGGMWTWHVVLLSYDFARKEWINSPKRAVTPYTIHEQKTTTDMADHMKMLSYYDRVHDAMLFTTKDEVWAYHFKENKWEQRGYTKQEFAAPLENLSQWTDSTVCFQLDWHLYEVDLWNNRWWEITEDNRLNASNINVEKYPFNPVYIYLDSAFVLREVVAQSTLTTSLHAFPIDGGSRVDMGKFYTPFHVPLIGLGGGIVLVVGIAIFFVFRHIKRRKVQETTQESHPKITLDPVQRTVLKALLKGPLSTVEINAFINIEKSSLDYQRRRRSEFIKELDQLGMHYFDQELLERLRDEEDRRLFLYKLRDEVRSELETALSKE